MSIEKTASVARAVHAQLHTAEEAIDTALAEAANLLETYVTSRRALQMAAMTATDVHENTLKAMQALNEAQVYMTAAHKGLSRIEKRLAIPAHLGVNPYDKDEREPDRPQGRLVQSREVA